MTIKEYRADVLKGSLVAIADTKERVEAVFSEIRARLLQLPAKLTSRLYGTDISREEFRDSLQRELDDVLLSLSGGEQ